MAELYQRIAVITGATFGIGEATVRQFLSNGIGVVGNGRNADKLAALESELGAGFCGVAGDAGDRLLLEQLFTAAKERFGQAVDIVVANAGRGLGGSVKDADLGEFEQLLKINVAGALTLLQLAARRMVAAQEKAFPKASADIVIVGSVVGRHVSPFSAIYGASKFAVHALAESLRREIGPAGVRVSLVEPGMALTGFQKGAGYEPKMVNELTDRFGPLLVGEDVANAIYYIVTRPPHVHISDMVVRPTRQDYP